MNDVAMAKPWHALMAAFFFAASAAWVMSAEPSSSAPAAGGENENVLASRSLCHSAMCLTLPLSKPPARAARLVALSNLAEELSPGDAQSQWLLANIYESQGKALPAIQALKRCLDLAPSDHALGMRWLNASLVPARDADERLAVLAKAADDGALPEPLRAEAAAMLGQTYLAKADAGRAKQAFGQALAHDPCNQAAVNGMLSADSQVDLSRRASMLLGLIQARPGQPAIGWELAQMLDELGLYQDSLVFFEHVWKLVQAHQVERDELGNFLAQYLSAMLDLAAVREDPNVAAKAIELFQPLLKDHPQNLDLHALVAEAYQLAGQTQSARPTILAIEVLFRQQEMLSRFQPPPALQAEIAWFNLLTKSDSKLALEYATAASAADSKSAVIQRILAAAQLAEPSSNEQVIRQATEQLAGLADSDPFAAYILAAQYERTGQMALAKQAASAGLRRTRSGPAFRRLNNLAQRLAGIAASAPSPVMRAQGGPSSAASQPDNAQIQQVAKVIADFDRRYLDLALNPQKYIQVTIAPAAQQFAPAEPIEIVVTLTMRREADGLKIPLGPSGLLNPTMALQVKVNTPEQRVFSNLPLVVWPAPKYLSAGQSLSTRVRVDCAALAEYLARNPMERMTLSVEGLVDPVQAAAPPAFRPGQDGTLSDRFTSAIAAVKVETASFDRMGLLELGDLAAIIGQIRHSLVSASLSDRLKAARRINSLLAYRSLVEQERSKPLAGRAIDTATADTILKLLKDALADRSFAVRAEALAGLQDIALDSDILALLAPAISDESPVVRLRVAEVLGQSYLPARQDVLTFLAKDANQWVSLAAQAMLGKP